MEKPRNSCMLHGALETIKQIEAVVPIVHSTSGCSVQNKYSGFSIPSTNLFERQVIFGATSRLREQIKNTLKVAEGDLYVVLSGCAAELIGDDVPAMVKEAQEQGEKVTFVETAGFKGSFQDGYVSTVNKLADYIAANFNINPTKEIGLVNILGVIPSQDIFWQGELLEIKRVLESIGLKVNTLLGLEGTIENWKNIPNAELNIVFSPWGLEIAEHLQDKFKIPYLNFYNLPVGIEETSKFLVLVGEKLNIEDKVISDYIEKEKSIFNYFIKKLSQIYYDYDLQKQFAIIGESGLTVGVTKFLSKTLGLIPNKVIITDRVDEVFKSEISSELPDSNIYFTNDSKTINQYLEDDNIELILGSSLEKAAAEKLNVPIVTVAYPALDEYILNRNFVGFKGAIELIEQLVSTIEKFESINNKQLVEQTLQLLKA